MRRARIKALASVPIRKNPVQDTAAPADGSELFDKEQKKEDASKPEYEPEVVKDVAEVKKQKEESISSDTEVLEQKVIKDSAKILEETSKKEQIKPSFVEPEPIQPVVKKSDSQESCSQKKPNSQELCAQVKPNSQELCAQAKPDSQELSNQINDKPEKPIDHLVQKTVPLPDTPSTGIDITSPTKNRLCFMRPVPRLDTGGRVRKNSIQGSGASASESEDEHGKRTASVVPSRIRNDSICSIQSNKESSTADNQNIYPKIKAMQKRRMQISESARKLAEARREFLLKHENKTPDKSQMKMYDFIYYNPVTNPMKSKDQQRIIAAQPIEMQEEEEQEDDPMRKIPAPQVKVGPDGQLIIDEQSTTIQHTDAKRVREIMSKDIIIEEGVCNNGGFYTKHKRSKDWPKWETLKFYRVLNVVGTDFLLMQTLFPNRTRQEIKQKYKKEERVNRQLIEKALKYHQEFDTEMLEEQLAMLQKLENIQNTPEKNEKTEKVQNGQNITKAAKRRKHRLVAKSIGECEALLTSNAINDEEAEDAMISTSDEIDVEINSEMSDTHQIRKGSKMRKRRLDDKSDDSDDNSASDFNSDSDSSPEIYRIRPTRSGRQPKKLKKLQAPDVNKLNTPNIDTESDSDAENKSSIVDNEVIPSHVAVEVTEVANTSNEDGENAETSCPENITSVIPNINQMEPGSLVIVSKESAEEPGNTILQVYMVSSNVDNTSTDSTDQQNLLKPLTTVTSESETVKQVTEFNEFIADQQNLSEHLTKIKPEIAEPKSEIEENFEK